MKHAEPYSNFVFKADIYVVEQLPWNGNVVGAEHGCYVKPMVKLN